MNTYEFETVLYYVSIDGTSITPTTSPNDGFIDHTDAQEYGVDDDFPTTKSSADAKERANMRYEEIVRKISLPAIPVKVYNKEAVGADGNTVATEYNFNVVYESPSHIFVDDDLSGGLLTGEDAVRHYVALALMRTWTETRHIYDPTTDTNGNIKGDFVENIEAGALTSTYATALAAVSVIIPDLST